MSLKAKIEAVIYAAEEPVTLAQLAGLFAEEALEEKRAREAAAQPAEPVNEASGSEVAGNEVPANEVSVVLSAEIVAPAENAAPDDGVVPAEAVEPEIAEAVEPEIAEAIEPEIEEAAKPEPEEAAEPLTVEEAAAMAARDAEQEAPATDVEAPATPSPEDEKRAARQRDREVREELRRILQELISEYAESDRGMEIREIANGYRVGTKPEYHDAVRGFVKSLKPPMKLSLQALETLAVIAYKQPVTAPEVGEIRGVDSAGVIGSLISRKLITTAGRKQVIGRPILYKTTKEFLLRFGLKDLNELPSMEEFEKMAAGELSEPGELPFEERAATPHAPVSEADEADIEEADEESEAEEIAKAQAAIEITDETAREEAVDFPGIAVEVEIETEDAEEMEEGAAEKPVEREP
jgi:segregation and condensation protein B